MSNIKFGFVLLLVVAGVLSMSTFIVHEREIAIKFKLGEIVDSDYEPGIYFQIPFINNVRKFDSRILTMDTHVLIFDIITEHESPVFEAETRNGLQIFFCELFLDQTLLVSKGLNSKFLTVGLIFYGVVKIFHDDCH